ncbi:MAG: replication protein [Desulfobacterales bacterium]|nr:replication protein [Desulfobacterales bacterium]
MASPQTENGYTKWANELLEALSRNRLAGQEYQVVLAVGRKTYGFGKKADMISYGQIAKMTGLDRRRVNQIIKNLNKRKILGVTNNGDREPLTIWINKDYEQWEAVTKNGDTPNNGDRGVPNNGVKPVPNNGDHKRKKETIQKKLFSSEQIEYRLANYLFNHIKKNNPNAKTPNLQSWARHVDLMIRRDNRQPEEIKTVIEWCQKDSFWYANILSTKKLREKYDQLVLKMGNVKVANPLADFDPEEERRKQEEALS